MISIDQYIREVQSSRKIDPAFQRMFHKIVEQNKQMHRFMRGTPDKMKHQLQNSKIKIILQGPPASWSRDFFHTHGYFELIYVYRGECHNIWWYSQEELLLHEQDILIINPQTTHSTFTSSTDDKVFNLVISNDLFEQSMLTMMEENHFLSSYISTCLYQVDRASDFILFPASTELPVQPLIELLVSEYYEQRECSQTAMKSLLVTLFAQLTRIYHSQNLLQDSCKNQKSNQTISEIISFISGHLSTVTLKEVSKEFGYTPAYISRLLRSYTGKSYAEIVRKFKLEQARSMLENSGLSVAEITEAVGYDAAYFYKIFSSTLWNDAFGISKKGGSSTIEEALSRNCTAPNYTDSTKEAPW